MINVGTSNDDLEAERRRVRRSSLARGMRVRSTSDRCRGVQISDRFAPNDVSGPSVGNRLQIGSPTLGLPLLDPAPGPAARGADRKSSSSSANASGRLPDERRPLSIASQRALAGEAPSPAAPPGVLDLAELSESGVSVFAVPDNGVFFVEVFGPDAVIGAVRTAALPTSSGVSGPGTPYFVSRAPRLIRRLRSTTNAEEAAEPLVARVCPAPRAIGWVRLLSDRGPMSQRASPSTQISSRSFSPPRLSA